MDAFHWIIMILLGLGLAASAGFNATLPLLLLSGLAHFHVAGLALGDKFSWLSSDAALVILGIAAVLEVVGDKIPGVDHLLHACGVFVRPAAGILAATSIFAHADPGMAAVAGILVGGPVAFGISGATGAARVASSATTLGCANPLLSVLEDFTSLGMALAAVFAPLLIPALLLVAGLILWKLVKTVQAGASRKSGRAVSP